MGRLAQLTQLFAEGKELSLVSPSGQMLFWINKLNPFESEECNKEGRLARARRQLAIRDVGTPDYLVFQAGFANASLDGLIYELVESRNNERWLKAAGDVRSDPLWHDKVELIEQTDVDSLTDEAEITAMAGIARDHSDEITRRVAQAREDEVRELKEAGRAEVEEKLRELYLETQGNIAFLDAMRRRQIYFALRECDATEVDGHWHHTSCTHHRVCNEIEDVASLPTTVLEPVLAAIYEVMVSPAAARFSAALTSSSGSSGSSSPAEGSPASSPAATSPEPATT